MTQTPTSRNIHHREVIHIYVPVDLGKSQGFCLHELESIAATFGNNGVPQIYVRKNEKSSMYVADVVFPDKERAMVFQSTAQRKGYLATITTENYNINMIRQRRRSRSLLNRAYSWLSKGEAA